MAFVKYLLDDVQEVGTTLHSNSDTGVTATNTTGYWHKFHMWVNKNEMANSLSILYLEDNGYNISYNTEKKGPSLLPMVLISLLNMTRDYVREYLP